MMDCFQFWTRLCIVLSLLLSTVLSSKAVLPTINSSDMMVYQSISLFCFYDLVCNQVFDNPKSLHNSSRTVASNFGLSINDHSNSEMIILYDIIKDTVRDATGSLNNCSRASIPDRQENHAKQVNFIWSFNSNYIFKGCTFYPITMRILAWNCQGFGKKVTRDHLRDLVRQYDPDVIFISEAKVAMDRMQQLIRSFNFPNRRLISPRGSAGGLILVWKDGFRFEVVNSDTWIINCFVQDDPSRPEWLLTCMYGSPYPDEKKIQWQYINDLSSTVQRPWVILGDLNVVFPREERDYWNIPGTTQASSSTPSSTINLITDAGLEDLGYSGRSYTWSSNIHGTGARKSRLDRALINADWTIHFPDSKLLHLAQLGSDHCPILLDTSSNNGDKKRNWKYFQCYEKDATLKLQITNAWESRFEGSPAFILCKKLQYARKLISKWNRDHFGNIQSNIDLLHRNLELTQQRSSNLVTTLEVRQIEKDIEHWHQIQSDFWGQKARDEYYLEIDRNTKYHHTNANRRRSRNNISALKNEEGVWCNTRESLENLLVNHFSSIHTSIMPERDEGILSCIPRSITDADNIALMRVPDVTEIRGVLKSMKPWKAPGPDGFPPGFFQSHWDVIGSEVVEMVQRFFTSGFLLKQLNNTNIALIPKTKHKQFPSDLRPIALCNTTYKLISKIMAGRMKRVMEKIISPLQAAYVKGRQISDNILLAQEIIHSMKQKEVGSAYMAIKLDMSKAFDRVEWSFLTDVMKQMGFCSAWCSLVMQCISTTRISVLLNGSPCYDYKPSRGLRQGDPLSPFLFIIVMEAFSRQLLVAEDQDLIKGIRIAPRAPSVSHLFFADDCLLFAQANLHNANNILGLLEKFGSASGQLVNFNKSSVYFSNHLPNRFCRIIVRRLRIQRMNPNERYLGIPLIIGKAKHSCFENIVEKVESKLSVWRSKTLSQCGRTRMIKTVTNTMPVYSMSCLQIPIGIVEKIDTLQRRFWWGFEENKGIFLTSWDKLCFPIELGGLGFRDLRILNKALLVRAAWRLLSQPNALWVKAITAKYFHLKNIFLVSEQPQNSWAWKGIMRSLDFIRRHSCWRVGNGKSIRIWTDIWIQGLMEPPSPNSSSQSHEQYVWVSELIDVDSRSWNIHVLSSLFTPEVVNCITKMRIPFHADDRLIWRLTKDGKFSLKSAYNEFMKEKISHITLATTIPNTDVQWRAIWKIDTWPRVRHFFWKCLQNIIPTRDRLSKVCNFINASCPLCGQENESIEHILVSCSFASAVWSQIPGGSCVLKHKNTNFSILQLASEWLNAHNEYESKERWINTALVVMSIIWNERCSNVNQNKALNPIATARRAVNFASYLENISLNKKAVQRNRCREGEAHCSDIVKATADDIHCPQSLVGPVWSPAIRGSSENGNYAPTAQALRDLPTGQITFIGSAVDYACNSRYGQNQVWSPVTSGSIETSGPIPAAPVVDFISTDFPSTLRITNAAQTAFVTVRSPGEVTVRSPDIGSGTEVYHPASIGQAVTLFSAAQTAFLSHANHNVIQSFGANQCITVNCDASFKNVSDSMGIGLIARDVTGSWRGSRIRSSQGILNSEQAECLAFLEAVKWSKEADYHYIVIQTDLKCIANYANGLANSIAWENEIILMDALYLLNSFCYWECMYIPRVCNKVADMLAKFSRRTNSSRDWYDDPPDVIVNQLSIEYSSLHS